MKVILNQSCRVKGFDSSVHVAQEVLDIGDPGKGEVELENVLVFPGLINAHDHLEFNLFPFLGNGPYQRYTEWSADIHRRYKDQIEKILRIPIDLRLKWGILKNLINGVTNVIHHGNHRALIRSMNYPVYLNYQYLHALETEPYWRLKLAGSMKKNVMIHVGEGDTEIDRQGIDRLLRWNIRKRNLVGIHAIGMMEEQAKKFKSIIWCPDSNLRLYGKTAAIDKLKKHTAILFGTDSTLTSSFDIWSQIRLARNLHVLSEDELLESLLYQPRNIFSDMEFSGTVIARRKSPDVVESFFSVTPEDIMMVICRNKVLLMDQTLLKEERKNYQPVRIGESIKAIHSSWAKVIVELESIGLLLPMKISAHA
jgi:hypothetical protein